MSQKNDKNNAFIRNLAQEIKQAFVARKQVLSFSEYLDVFQEKPWIHARNAAQYLLDCIRYFGMNGQGFRLFDLEFEPDGESLIGQFETQQAFFKVVEKFVRQGRVNRLILLHGPNGSAKTTFVNALATALEYYSGTDEGALYKFNWVFPVEGARRKLGFTHDSPGPVASYALLPEDQIATRIASSMKDHPLMLIPKKNRRELLQRLLKDRDFKLSFTILDGDLSHLSRQIFDTLLTAYQGDLEKVLMHVQVQRFFLSRRFRRGLVTIEPQVQVDAGLRQVSMNRSFESLPRVLQNMNLYEPFGDLADGNRGMIEFNDLLKRPVDSYKYLLATVEKGTVSLPAAILHLDTVFVATTNDVYLEAFMEHPDWPSFKGRMELVRTGYLLSYDLESRVYESRVGRSVVEKPVAPRTYLFAGMFAVASRMVPPNPDEFADKDRELVSKLGPVQKADLYSGGPMPQWADMDTRARLRSLAGDLLRQGAESSPYEGRHGPSPREMMGLLLDILHDPNYPCLSPNALFFAIEGLLKEKRVYRFLQLEPKGDFFNYTGIIEQLRARYMEWVDRDLKQALELDIAAGYHDLFEKYVDQVSHLIRNEQVKDPITGQMVPPDQVFITQMEENMGIAQDDAKQFRSALLSKIGAWSLDHPGEPINYEALFSELFSAMTRRFYDSRRAMVRRRGRLLLDFLSQGATDEMGPEQDAIRQAAERFTGELGYARPCAIEAVSLLLKQRYAG